MKLKTHEPEQCRPDMTPLIDCVFLLILFFILTTKITVQIEELELPVALEGEQQEDASRDVVQPLIVNIIIDPEGQAKNRGERAGLIRFQGDTMNQKQFKEALLREVIYDREPPPRGRGSGYEPGPGDKKLSKLKVLVRGDKAIRSEFAQQVFQACGEVGIYKLVVASQEPE